VEAETPCLRNLRNRWVDKDRVKLVSKVMRAGETKIL
jgi:hypothetical protein